MSSYFKNYELTNKLIKAAAAGTKDTRGMRWCVTKRKEKGRGGGGGEKKNGGVEGVVGAIARKER